MIETDEIIKLSHGEGGKLTQKLIRELFLRHFPSRELSKLDDAAFVEVPGGRMVFTTDSFVVNPVFFPGGDVGKLSVCGTVNDLAVMGAEPKYISCGLVIEEGFPLADLERIISSMAETAKEAGVEIVTGDTKVVERGACDKIFINTAGIGELRKKVGLSREGFKHGDKIIISGTLGDHSLAVLSKRFNLEAGEKVVSDCAPLNKMIAEVLTSCRGIKFMRDPTRGGIASVLNEIIGTGELGAELEERSLPVKKEVQALCEILGYDPFYLANEGKVLIIVASEEAQNALKGLKNHPLGRDSAIIGALSDKFKGRVTVSAPGGGSRILPMLAGGQLPRIC